MWSPFCISSVAAYNAAYMPEVKIDAETLDESRILHIPDYDMISVENDIVTAGYEWLRTLYVNNSYSTDADSPDLGLLMLRGIGDELFVVHKTISNQQPYNCRSYAVSVLMPHAHCPKIAFEFSRKTRLLLPLQRLASRDTAQLKDSVSVKFSQNAWFAENGLWTPATLKSIGDSSYATAIEQCADATIRTVSSQITRRVIQDRKG